MKGASGVGFRHPYGYKKGTQSGAFLSRFNLLQNASFTH